MANFNLSTKSLLSLLSDIHISTPSALPEETKPDYKCKALTQNHSTRQHTGHRCSRDQVVDTTKPRELKTTEELVADELCSQHKKTKERFMDMIIPQLDISHGSKPILMSVNGDKQQPRVTAQVSTAQRLQPISTSANGDKQQPQVTAEASPSQQPKHLGGQASVLTTPKPTQVQLDAITKSTIKRGMGVIIAQATEIMLDGSLHPSDQIATKALTIRKLAHEMNKLLDLTKATDETEEPISHGTDASFTAKRRSQSSSRINSTSNKEWNSSWA